MDSITPGPKLAVAITIGVFDTLPLSTLYYFILYTYIDPMKFPKSLSIHDILAYIVIQKHNLCQLSYVLIFDVIPCQGLPLYEMAIVTTTESQCAHVQEIKMPFDRCIQPWVCHTHPISSIQ